MRVMIPNGVATAYRLCIAYFDVIARQGLPKALHFLSTSSSSYSIARLSLKATASAIDRRMSIPERAIARKLWATDQVAASNLMFLWFRPQGCPVDRGCAPEQTTIDMI
jgi:hypothetical protein